MPPEIVRALRWLIPLLVAHSGLFLALTSPHRPVPGVWAVALAPMFLALDLSLRRHRGRGRDRWWKVAGCTLPAGVVFAAVTGGWVVNTAHVFGALPLPLAYAVGWLAYGGFFGLELFAYLGIPFALTWRRPALSLLFVPLWATMWQLYVPRFLFFTYGQAMHTAPALVQFADLLGSGGLNLLYLPLQLVLCFWLRAFYAPEACPRRLLAGATAAMALLYLAAYGYGHRQLGRLEAQAAAGRPVELVGIQPDFSLKHLASNPALSPSDRQQSLEALLADSGTALRRAQRDPGVPTVLLWPESVYPRAYFFDRSMREIVERWVRREGVELILATQDARFLRDAKGGTAREIYGAAIHLDADGLPRGLYHKISLIPFGETIPLADWFPFYRRWLLAWIPRIGEFTPGREYTVFTLANGVKVAPMICFDAADASVARGMARNGARLGVVLANLAWFGPTTVSRQFEWFARFRAIENRMPILLLSQNGESILLDAGGREISARLPQFAAASLVQTVNVPPQGAFYSAHGHWVHRAIAASLLIVALIGWRHRLFQRRPNPPRK